MTTRCDVGRKGLTFDFSITGFDLKTLFFFGESSPGSLIPHKTGLGRRKILPGDFDRPSLHLYIFADLQSTYISLCFVHI